MHAIHIKLTSVYFSAIVKDVQGASIVYVYLLAARQGQLDS